MKNTQHSSLLSALICLPLLGACASHSKPAQLLAPSANCQRQIGQAIYSQLGYEVAIASDAFVQSATVLIERKSLRSPDGPKIQGRDFEIPQKFTLLSLPNACAIRHEQTGNTVNLDMCSCKASIAQY